MRLRVARLRQDATDAHCGWRRLHDAVRQRWGVYLQGSYTATQASYSHHTRYVYRSSDVQGLHADKDGVYHHLLLVKVLHGNPLKTAAVWKGKDFSYTESQLGREYDSVEGGPHQPVQAGPGPDDSIIYVVYHSGQCLPEFIVTYKAK